MKMVQKKSKAMWLVAMTICLPMTLSAQTHFQFGNSMRNNQLSHYYKMVSWDDHQYQEATYWLTNSAGSVLEFMNWRIVFPPGYQQTGSTKYPMILMLHGAGESGRVWSGNFDYPPTDPRYDNNDNNLKWGGQEHLNAVNSSPTNSRSFPGIVVFPQVSYNGAWSGDWNSGTLSANNRMAVGIIEYLIANYNVDQYRIVVHGLSAGAKGVWDIAAKRPDLFAGMLPMSGVGTDINAMTDILVTTPIWLFQGGQDTNPSPGYAQQWIDALKNKGGNPRFTIYPNLGHGVWNTAYQEPDFFSWIKSKDKRNIYVFGGTTSLDANPSIKLGFSDGFTNYQWQKDGVDIAGANSRYYTATASGAYAVRFTRRTDGGTGQSFVVNITDTPAPPPPPQNGVAYKYYQTSNAIDNVGSFNFSQSPAASGTASNFTNSVRKRDNMYVLSFDGQIQIDNAGTYIFYTNSDDGSQLFINGARVVNNDGKHSARVASGSYSFSTTGLYPIRVTYFQNSGGQTLTVKYNQGLINNYSLATTIPNNKLFLPANASATSSMLAASETSSTFSNPGDSLTYAIASTDSTLVLRSVWPNPFDNEIHILYNKEPGPQAISLIDMVSGSSVKNIMAHTDGNETILDFSDVIPGQYVLTVVNTKYRVLKTAR